MKKLLLKFKETVFSVLPITLIVLILGLTIAPLESEMIWSFIVGAVFVIIGMSLFSLGAEISMIQMGEKIVVGEETHKKSFLDFKWMAGDNTIMLKMAVVGWLGYLVSYACSGIPIISNLTNANIMYLVMGIIFCVLGFLPANAHVKAHMNGLLMVAVLSVVPGSLATLSLQDLLNMLVPLVGTLIVGAIFVCIFGAIAGKVLNVHWTIAFAIAICCTIGYPGTQIIVDEVVRSLDCDEETRVEIYEHVLPQIIVSGFTSVTVASVFFAGIICPLIF